MRIPAFVAVVIAFGPALARAQTEPLKAEASKVAPPADLAGPLKEALGSQAVRIVDGDGKPYVTIWLRKAIPASSKPAGPKGAVLYPFLEEGEFLGALRFEAEGHDYRDQAIAAGTYTVRYGLQPVNGDHLGVSTYRDYLLLLPASKDKALADVPQKTLEKTSAEAAGSSHPAVFLLVAAPTGAKGDPAMVHDESKNLWGLVLALPIAVKGESSTTAQPVQMIVLGAAMN